MIIDSHQHLILPTELPLQKMNEDCLSVYQVYLLFNAACAAFNENIVINSIPKSRLSLLLQAI